MKIDQTAYGTIQSYHKMVDLERGPPREFKSVFWISVVVTIHIQGPGCPGVECRLFIYGEGFIVGMRSGCESHGSPKKFYCSIFNHPS